MSFLVNPYAFAGVIELARDTAAFTDTTNLTTYTSDARSIGAASATREVYAMIMADVTIAGRTLSSASIGGVGATIHGQVTVGASLVVAIVSATVPTGTTAVVGATFSAVMNAFGCVVIALDGLLSATPVDIATGTSAAASVSTGANLDLAAGGYVMAIAADILDGGSGTVNISWTNATETVATIEISNQVYFGVAYASNVDAASGSTVTATWDSDDPTADKAIVALSVR